MAPPTARRAWVPQSAWAAWALLVLVLPFQAARANSGSRDNGYSGPVEPPLLSWSEASELAALGSDDRERSMSEAGRKMRPGEWRVDCPSFRIKSDASGKPEAKGNVSLVTADPERALSLLLRRPVTRREVLSAGFVRPDFIVSTVTHAVTTSTAATSTLSSLEAFRDGDAYLAARLVEDTAKAGVRVAQSMGDEGRSIDPSGKKNPRATSAGTLLYISDPNATGYGPALLPSESRSSHGRSIELMHCPGRVASYSGAYLVTRSLFLQVDYAIKNHLEAASMNTFGAADYAMKAADFRDFFVNHFSEWEHWYKRQKTGGSGHLNDLSQMMDRECAALLRDHPGDKDKVASAASGAAGATLGGGKKDDGRSPGLVLVPFWGGTALESGGNSHSEATSDAKLMQAAGTVCSGLRYFRRAVVGTCRAEDAQSFKAWLEKSPGFKGLVTIYSPSVEMSYGRSLGNLSDVKEGTRHLGTHPMKLVTPGAPSSTHNRPALDGDDEPAPPMAMPPPNSVTILQFNSCAKGVHLPYHLLATVQALFRKHSAWSAWPAPASFAAREAKAKGAKAAEAVKLKRGFVRGKTQGGDDKDIRLSAWDSNGAPGTKAEAAAEAAVEAEAEAEAEVEAEAEAEATKVEADTLKDLWVDGMDGVDFLFYSEADQLAKFRDAATARAIASSLVHAPTKASQRPQAGLAPFPVSHKDKIHGFVPSMSILEILEEAMQEKLQELDDARNRRDANLESPSLRKTYANALRNFITAGEAVNKTKALLGSLDHQAAAEALLDRTEFYMAPARMAMRFTANEFKLLEHQPSYAAGTMTLSEAFDLIDQRDSTKDGKRAYTLTNACSVCPPFQCPKDDSTPKMAKFGRPQQRIKGSDTAAQDARYSDAVQPGAGKSVSLKPSKGSFTIDGADEAFLKAAKGAMMLDELPSPPPETRSVMSYLPNFALLGGRVPLDALTPEQEHAAKVGRKSMGKLKSTLSGEGGMSKKERKDRHKQADFFSN